MNKDVTILDCTLRDGSYVADFKIPEMEDISLLLSEAGLKYIEVGHGLGLGYYRKKDLIPDQDYLPPIRKKVSSSKSKIGTFFIPGIGTLDDISIAKDLGIDFIRIGTNASEYESAFKYIEHALDLGLEVYYNFMKSYIMPPFKFLHCAKEVSKTGVAGVYLVDSAGGMLPEQVAKYIKLLKENLPCKVGFHGHNNLMLVNANNIEGIKSGIDMVDTTLMGLGRGGGNSQTEIMLYILDKLGIQTGIDNKKILDIGKKYIEEKAREDIKSYDLDVVSGFAMFHSSFLEMFSRVAKDRDVDLRELIIRVCEINKEDPDIELIENIARDISNSRSKVFSPKKVN